MPTKMMKLETGCREVRGMRKDWQTGVRGLITVLRVLPPELYGRVMSAEREVQPVEVFNRVVEGDYATDCQKG